MIKSTNTFTKLLFDANILIMYLRKIFFVLACLSLQSVIFGQNSPDFFKTTPRIDDSFPDWAQLMYGINPNVFEIDDAYIKYFKSNEFEKTIHTQNYKHWRWRIEEYINQDGYIVLPTRSEETEKTRHLKKRLKNRMKGSGSRNSNPEWQNIGPFETYFTNDNTPVSWHKNIYSIDQSESTPNTLVCGTEAGGIYKSTDKGLNWSLISKYEVFNQGNTAVKIHPTNPDFYLIASNSRIYKTTTGGTTWTEVHYINGSGYEFRFDPSNPNTIYCVASTGLYKSSDAGENWSQIFSDKCWDIDFHPTDPSIIYLLKSNPTLIRSELFRSDDGGTNWTLKDNGYYLPEVPGEASESGGKIGVTPAEEDYVYVCLIGESKDGDDGWIGVYKSINNGDSWNNLAGQDGGPYGAINGTDPWNVAAYSGGYHQGWFNFDMEVSDTDADKLWIATVRLSESSDGGATFLSIGAANSDRLSNIHADVQDLEVNGSDIWVATDGGINFSPDELNSHDSRKKGIQASHFWGFNTGWNQDSYTGGRYHDGTIAWYENYPDGTVFNIGGVEEPSGYVNPLDGRKMYYRTHYSSSWTSVKSIPEFIGGLTIQHSSLPLYPNESYYSSSSSGIYFDHRYANHLFIGRDNKLYKSIDGGSNFEVLYTFPDGLVYEIEQSRKDYNVIYLVFKPDETSSRVIYKSVNGGQNFTQINNVPGNRTKIEISLNPIDENEIWVGLGNGSNGSKVYSSTNSGDSWTNRTTDDINGESIRDIRYQGGSDDVVYLASHNTVFHFDATSDNWIEYGSGLPLIVKSLKLNPFYRDAELRLGSSGRGVFGGKMADTLFSPIAQPITYGDTVFCKNDTIQFDCYSILKPEGASWTWEFDPEPVFVNSIDIRNPRVVFGNTGSYSVTLSVTDGNDQSDSRTIPDMIFVSDRCEPDTIPGKMLSMQDNDDYAQIPNLALQQVDTLSITAWVKPLGIQPDYSGIVMNDGETAGFNFANGDNTLMYHWPGGQWWWNSGLIVPENEWSHVAMVATDNAMKLYLNGEEAVHNIDLQPADIETVKIGSYKGWSSRNMNGYIDEVAIWSRALSQNEIQDLRHLTKEDTLGDPDFIAYYQFNESVNNPVFDKTSNSHHATLLNGALRINSNVPVGGGKSQRMSINAEGVYDFSAIGFKIRMPENATYPDGDLVISRLNILPETTTGMNDLYDHFYWIVNNYGINESFTIPDSLWLFDLNYLYESDPSIYFLLKREENGNGSNWQNTDSPISAENSPLSTLVFTDVNALDSSGQLLLQFRIESTDIIWTGSRWEGGSGPEGSPGINDLSKKVIVMPGNPGQILGDANCKEVILFENAVLIVPNEFTLTTQD